MEESTLNVTAFQTSCSNRRLALHPRAQRFAGGLAGALVAELCRCTVKARRAFDLADTLDESLASVRLRAFRMANREPPVEGTLDWLTMLSSGASARKVALEMTTEHPFKMVAEANIAEVIVGVSAGGCRSAIWSAEYQIIDV